MTIHANFSKEKWGGAHSERNAGNEQTGLIAPTHILNVTSHCKNKKIDDAVWNLALTSNTV